VSEDILAVTFEIKEGHHEEARRLFAKLREASRQEPGVRAYDIYEKLDEPGTVLVLERYADRDAFKAHTQTAHFAAIMPRLSELVGRRHIERMQQQGG